MITFLSVLFSFVLLNNKGLESHDSPDLDDADSSNFRWRSNCFLCFCSLQAVRNSAKANPVNPSTMRPMPMNACHGRRYFCTIQSTITDAGIANIVPTLCNKCKDADFFYGQQWPVHMHMVNTPCMVSMHMGRYLTTLYQSNDMLQIVCMHIRRCSKSVNACFTYK